MRADRRLATAAAVGVAAALIGGAAATGLIAASFGGTGSTPVYVVYNGTANAAADRVQVLSSAYPNYTNGIVDNRYPLAHVHVDNSPSTQATASPADTGPFGQTVAAMAGQTQPQYADVRYPPGRDGPVTYGTEGGPFAEARAGEASATARAAAVGTPALPVPPGSSPPATPAQVVDAWRAWVQRFVGVTLPGLVQQGLPVPSRVPSPQEIVSSGGMDLLPPIPPPLPPIAPLPALPGSPAAGPDGIDGSTAVTTAGLDTQGRLLVQGDARVARAVFLGGLLVLHGIHTAVAVVNDGTARPTITADVASAEVGGVPVRIGSGGVEVAGSRLADPSTAQKASEQLNGLLGRAGLSVSLLQGVTTAQESQMNIHATGVLVTYVRKGSGPGQPDTTVRDYLADVEVESLAVLQQPFGEGAAGVQPPASGAQTAAGGGPVTGEETSVPTESSPASPRTSPPAVGPSPLLRAVQVRPLWLLLLYGLWQSLLVGSVASLAWWRMQRRVTA
jgi:hypothetical protein